MKKNIMNRSFKSMAALSLALLTALAAMDTANAAYWNRSRNQRGGSDDSGASSSSSGGHRGRDLDGDGIPNISDPDVDNDGIPNGRDPNVDGGVALSGKYAGKYIGDRLPNDHPGEKDIDDDGLDDNSSAELDIDGDGLLDDSPDETDIDGDGRSNDADDDKDGDDRGNSVDDDDDGTGHESGDDNTGTPPAAGPVGDGNAPASVNGVSYVVRQSNGAVEENLNFTGATAGNESDPDGDVDNYTYTYSANGTTASLRLQFKSDKWDEYDLDYATGGYVRREFDKNQLKDTDTGSFNLTGVTPPPPPPTTGGSTNVVGDGNAPAALSGVTWVVKENNGHVEANLLFTSATNGSENDPSGDIDPFTYTYTATGTTATLRLDFKVGKWDEYDLDFANGTYSRREFKHSSLDDTDTGIFALPAAP